jgi:hypothetical protein
MAKKEEAVLVGYKLLYNRSGKLITERISVDIKELEPYFNKEEFSTLQTVVRECTQRLDSIHHYIESNLNARLMKD